MKLRTAAEYSCKRYSRTAICCSTHAYL